MKHAYVNWGGRWLSTDVDGVATLVRVAITELRRLAPDRVELVVSDLMGDDKNESGDSGADMLSRSIVRSEINDLVRRGVLVRKGGALVVASLGGSDDEHPSIKSKVSSRRLRSKKR